MDGRDDIDVQYFGESGTWTRPPGAVRVDCLIKAAGGGGAVGLGKRGTDGEDGALHAYSLPADSLPETVEITIGKGGRGASFGDVKGGDGRDGYVLVLTHLKTDLGLGSVIPDPLARRT